MKKETEEIVYQRPQSDFAKTMDSFYDKVYDKAIDHAIHIITVHPGYSLATPLLDSIITALKSLKQEQNNVDPIIEQALKPFTP